MSPTAAIIDNQSAKGAQKRGSALDPHGFDAGKKITVLGLSWDHRALDGALAAQFLAAVKRRIEAI